MAKLSNSRRVRLGVSALIAALLSASLGVVPSSARSGPVSIHSNTLNAGHLTAASPFSSETLASGRVKLSVAKLTVSIKTQLKEIKIEARKAKFAIAALKRARLVRISRHYSRPVSNYRLSAGFGARSRLWANGSHTGQDFAAPYGTRVKAAEAGRVVFAGWDGPYGWKIALAHGDGVQTWYGHLSRINVRVGQRVKVGQFIGRVGASGNVTGAHLHFEVQRNGVPIDPVKWLRAVGIWV